MHSQTRLTALRIVRFVLRAAFLSLFLPISLRAQMGNDNPTGVSGVYNGNVTTAGSYDPYTGNATRSVTDITVAGAVGAYPLAFTRTMNSRYTPGAESLEFGQSGTWRHSYQWSMDPVTVVGYNPGPSTVNFPDGRRISFGSGGADPCYRGPSGVQERLQNVDWTNYYLILPDGGKVWFQARLADQWGPDGGPYTTVFEFDFKGLIDPYGQLTTVTYPSDGSMTITEPAGRTLKLFYITTPWNGDTVIDRVVASDGRSVKYNYGSYGTSNGTVYTFLSNIVYFGDSSLVAIYAYQNSNVDPNGRPLLQWAIDTMYGGPMWAIGYTFVPAVSGGVYGQLQSENYLDPRTGTVGQVVSSLSANGNSRTETRGDGPSRTFNYSGGKLVNYTDFKGQTSYISYDGNGYTSAFTDARGHTTTTSREGIIGALSVLTHPDTEHSIQGYAYWYSNGGPYYVQTRGDERGHNTYFTRDGNFQLTRIDYPDYPNGAYETFAYNGFGQVYSHRMTSGGTETRYIDGRGMMWASNNPDGTSYYYYDGNDRLEHITDPRSNTTWFQYSARGQVTRVTHMDGSYVQYGYDNHGDLTSITDELNHTNTYVYDDYKRVVNVTNPLNQTTSYVYAQDWSNSYNQTTSSIKGAFSPLGKAVHYAYDENWQRSIMRIPPGSDPNDAWTYYAYDAAGNLTWTQDPRGYPTTFAYDERNRRSSVTDALNQTTSWQYDGTSNLTRETRPDQSYRRAEYDSMNRVIDTYGFANEHTHYDRDLAGNVHQLVDSKGAGYVFYYDAMNRKASEFYPTDATGVSRYNAWYRDGAGNVYRHDGTDGNVQILEYDNRNRMCHSYWWSNVGPNTTMQYDFANRITNVTTNGAETTVAFGYDDANRKVWEDQTLTGYPTHRVWTTRDDDGNRHLLDVPNYYAICYDYTQRNQLNTIYGGNMAPVFHYTYDASGNMTKRQAPWMGINDSVNVVDWNGTNQYDALNRACMWENTGAGDAPFARSWYQYDSLGRVTATVRDEQSGKGERYGYDAMNQLTSVSYNADGVWNGNPQNATRTVNYNLDALNRQSVNENGTVTGYSPNALNQYQSFNGTTYNYDNNFNLREAPNWGGSFDAQSQLTVAAHGGGVAYLTYDGLGRCVRRTFNPPGGGSSTVIYVYDGWNPIVEFDAAGNFQAWNIYGAKADEILARWVAGVGNFSYHSDKNGNIYALMDSSGNVVEKYSYDAFGQPTITDWYGNPHVNAGGEPQSWYGNRFMFQGREYLSELGIYDFRNRYYHPALGRFLQSDPIGFGGGDANLFRYCGGDPVNRSDPSGLDSKKYQNEGILPSIQGSSILGGWTGPDGISYGGGGNSNASGGGVGGYTVTGGVDGVTLTLLPPPASFPSGDLGFRPGDISLGIDITSSTRFSFFPPTSNPRDYRDFGPSSEDLSPLQAALIGLYLAFHGDIRDGLFARTEMGAAANAPNFVVTPGGTVFPVPAGATGPVPAASGNGFQFTGGTGGNGLSPSATSIRLMNPVTTGPFQYPGGYGSYSNVSGQTINPYTGQTIAPSDPWWHIPGH